MRGRHARARQGRVATAGPRGPDADSRRRDGMPVVVGVAREVGEGGTLVVDLSRAGSPERLRFRRACPSLSATAVTVRTSGNQAGHVGRRCAPVPAVVAGGGRVQDAGVGRVADRLVQRVAGAGAVVVAEPAEAHVGDLDPERRGVRRHPVDAADDVGPQAAAAAVEHLHRVQLPCRVRLPPRRRPGCARRSCRPHACRDRCRRRRSRIRCSSCRRGRRGPDGRGRCRCRAPPRRPSWPGAPRGHWPPRSEPLRSAPTRPRRAARARARCTSRSGDTRATSGSWRSARTSAAGQLGGEALQRPPVLVAGVEAEVLLALTRLGADLTARDGVRAGGVIGDDVAARVVDRGRLVGSGCRSSGPERQASPERQAPGTVGGWSSEGSASDRSAGRSAPRALPGMDLSARTRVRLTPARAHWPDRPGRYAPVRRVDERQHALEPGGLQGASHRGRRGPEDLQLETVLARRRLGAEQQRETGGVDEGHLAHVDHQAGQRALDRVADQALEPQHAGGVEFAGEQQRRPAVPPAGRPCRMPAPTLPRQGVAPACQPRFPSCPCRHSATIGPPPRNEGKPDDTRGLANPCMG